MVLIFVRQVDTGHLHLVVIIFVFDGFILELILEIVDKQFLADDDVGDEGVPRQKKSFLVSSEVALLN